MTKLVLDKLSKVYGKEHAVHDVSVALAPGEFVSLLGPSGCGKTTTLRMIAGFMSPSSGTISIDGRVVSSAQNIVQPEKRGMSMIFQSYAIWPNMTVGENVAFGLNIRRMDRDTVKKKVNAILETVRLTHLKDRYPSELSGGQQQRVALARAIVIEPAVLLLDEPLSNLDANLREEMRYEIKRLHDQFNITSVYVTHDQSEAMSSSDRIIVMNGGKVEQIDAPFDLYNRPRTAFVAGFIGKTNLIRGRVDGSRIVFPGFDAPNAGVADSQGDALFSLRPQHFRVRRDAVSDDALWTIPSVVRERVYLGDSWDYTFNPRDSGEVIRVSAPPHDVFEAGEEVQLSIRPELVIRVEG